MTNELDHIFNPKSVALIGATDKEGKVGHAIMKNLLSFVENNSGNKLYPVNPKYKKILGINCYKSVLNIEDDIDLAIIAVPNVYVPDVMEECGKKGVKGVVIITAGFSEVGNYELEEKIKNIGKKYNMRIIGPNCLGIINMHNKLNASFSKSYFNPGNITFISQSGAVLTAVLDIAPLLNLGFSKIISLGNKVDIQESDLMDYLINDEKTEVVVFYIEGLKDGKFIESCRKLSKIKPVLVLKSGKTVAGAKAASSHTGSLAGDNQIYNAVFKKSRALTVETFEELVDLMHVFSTQPLMNRNNVGIITNAGGFGVMAADSCSKYGLKLPNFEEKSITILKENLPSSSTISNPLDLIGDADTDRYRVALETLKDDNNIDGLIVILTPQEMTKPLEVAGAVVDVKNKMKEENIKKPIVCSFVGGKSIKGAKSYLRKNGIPAYISPESAAEVLSNLYKYSNMRAEYDDCDYYNKLKEELLSVKNKYSDRINELLKNPNEYNAKEFLKLHGFNVPKRFICKSPEECEEFAKLIGTDIVMKISSKAIKHKSDANCVIIKPKDIKESFNKIMENGKKYLKDRGIDGQIDGVLIEEYVEGLEMIIGGKRDDVFKGVVMVGLGGVFVEVLKDVSFGIVPISKNYAQNILKELKSYKILEGIRGRPKRDIDYVVDAIMRVGVILEIYDNIKEIDINPLFIKEEGKGGVLGDALIVVD